MQSGGAEKIIAILANHYCNDLKWSVEIVLLLGNSLNQDLFHLDNRIKVVDMSRKGSSYLRNSIGWVCSIRNYIKDTKPNCIVSFIGRINALVLTSSLGLNVPTLVSERNDPKHDGRGKLMLKYCNLIYRRAKAIVHQTKYEESCFSKALSYKSHIIPNPAVELEYDNKETIDNLIITTGRLTPQKNQLMLVKAIEKIAPEINVRCEIYGDGVQREELQSYIDNHKLSSSVILMGSKPNVSKYVSKCSVFVMTSYFEGLSNSIIEALMLGKPCISTRYPGADEIVQDGYNGALVDIDNVDQLAEEIKYILLDKELQSKLSKNAKLSSQRYTYSNVIKEWDEVIFKMLNKN